MKSFRVPHLRHARAYSHPHRVRGGAFDFFGMLKNILPMASKLVSPIVSMITGNKVNLPTTSTGDLDIGKTASTVMDIARRDGSLRSKFGLGIGDTAKIDLGLQQLLDKGVPMSSASGKGLRRKKKNGGMLYPNATLNGNATSGRGYTKL